MEEIKDKLAALKRVSKLEKIKIYQEIIEISYKNKSERIFYYFDQILLILEDYFQFDPNPPDAIKKQFSLALKYVFLVIRRKSDTKNFDKYIFIFNKFKHLIIEPLIIAKIYQVCGFIFFLKNEIDLSLKYLTDSLKIINKAEIVDEIPERYTNLGFVYEYTGNYKQAEYYYKEGLTFAQVNNFDDALRLAFAGLGRLHLRLKDYRQAIKYFERHLALIKEPEKSLEAATTKSNIAMAYMHLNMTEKSLEISLQLEKAWIRKAEPDLYFTIIQNIGTCYCNNRDLEKARSYYLRALDYANNVEDTPLRISTKINLAYVEFYSAKFDEAIDYLQKAGKLIEKGKNKRQYLEIQNFLGTILRQQKKFEAALEKFKSAKKLSTELGDKIKQIEITEDIAFCYNNLGNYQKAYEVLSQSLKLRKEIELKKNEEKDAEIEKKIIDSGNKHQYIYSNSISLISKDLSKKIGQALIGRSKEMQDVIEKAFIAAKNQTVNVMIFGESGTGKELIAKLIHYASKRANYPFVEVNSAVFTTSLAESSLFGHKKGAFTGAVEDFTGHFETAHKGTLFLDEISEMPSKIQSMMLRVLETKQIKPLGAKGNKQVDFRLICASNHDIRKLSEEHKFRFDLFNRINALELNLPALRQHKIDIPLLINYFLTVFSEEIGKKVPTITKGALDKLYNYDYPGNIRELKNIIQSLLLFCKKDIIEADEILISNTPKIDDTTEFDNLDLVEHEKKLIHLAMLKSDNVITNAAKLLGISSYALSRRLKKYEMS
ncbi:MAG: sigma 54-interacting transcriptional regulator [Candidatus Cloacimonetes bacterium]|nr:sigma 54-interacting transcriptional regulator [Candidatus Cloacimonadota bacterium]MCF7868779.1 sigma 54-interacting transcriptional regulator [Candidatus Cloacimonadota bacterium]MCF7884209.1 sigma 54-interacting transcriptional regulator [Candidatus Cloacimonadota bacterium]